MSARKRKLVLSYAARQDLRDILSYTHIKWGVEKRVLYRKKLDAALKVIMENPEIGYKSGKYSAFKIGQHNIYYHLDKSAIYVVRILHKKMDSSANLSEN
jgi:plasmid stabilization system protein ParE